MMERLGKAPDHEEDGTEYWDVPGSDMCLAVWTGDDRLFRWAVNGTADCLDNGGPETSHSLAKRRGTHRAMELVADRIRVAYYRRLSGNAEKPVTGKKGTE